MPVWSGLERPDADRLASHVLALGIASLVLFFGCLGPLAGLVAIGAYRANVEFHESQDLRRTPVAAYRRAKAGMLLARITGVLSISSLIAILLLALAIPF